MGFIPSEIIENKKQGREHQPEEIQFLIESYVSGELKDYQMSAWAMAVWFNGMTPNETAVLTESMLHSGQVFDFSDVKKPVVDKHSTGGVGDKTSMILAPIAACAGISVPMISGRGLGHTGGTLDKLESIPGFRVGLEKKEFESHLREYGMAMMGQTSDICPADKKFYALRDVTATVNSIPLICASIMSKKLAEGISGLVLDVKYGSGAFIQDPAGAEELARLMIATGKHHGVKVAALMTSMEQPLGRYAGNALEIKECLDILAGQSFIENDIDFYEDTRKLSLELAGYMIWVGGKTQTPKEGIHLANEILESGDALKAFEELCQFQGPADFKKLPKAKYQHDVVATKGGYVQSFQTNQVGWASLELGAGRKTVEDTIDPAAGVEICCRLGQKVAPGQKIFVLHGNDKAPFAQAEKTLLDSVVISETELKKYPPLIAKVLS